MPIIGIQSSARKSVPDAPTIGTATDVGTSRAYNNGAAIVTFTAPSFDGKMPITSYTVTSSPGGFTASGASSPLTVTGLQSSIQYSFTVTATNAIGISSASSASNLITATTVPQAPTIGAAADGGTGTTATVAYTANATGGKAVSVYTATSSPGSLTGTGASPITVSGLTTGTAYTFTVTATNANGTSTASAASNSVTPASPSSYESIATLNGDGSSTELTFSSIPSTYKSLQVRIFANTTAGTGYGSMRVNGDATTGNYFWHYLNANATSVSASGNAGDNNIYGAVYGNAGPNLYYGVSIIDIIDYASTSKNKTVRIFNGQDTNGTDGQQIQLGSGVWKSTTAINSLTIRFSAGRALTTDTKIALYGVK